MSLPGTILHAILIISIIFVLPLNAEKTPANSADLDNSTDTMVSETTQASPGLSPPNILTPDLSLSDLEIVEQVRGGEKIVGSVIITNKGPVSASRISMDILLVQENPDGNISVWLGSRGTDKMPPGTKGRINFSFDLPPGIRDGEYYICINILGHESELFTSDNTITSERPVTISDNAKWSGEIPDLCMTIDSVSTSETSAGSPLTIAYTIKNKNRAVAGSCRILFLLSPDKAGLNSGYHLLEERIFKIYPDMNEQRILTELVPDHIPPGSYRLIGVIDYTGMIQETDKTDNFFVFPEKIEISGPLNWLSESYTDQVAGMLFLKTNKYREHLGLSPLSFDIDLRKLAAWHTGDMIQRGYFSHYSPEGTDPTGRAELMGYPVTRTMEDGRTRTGIAENIIRIASGHTVGKAYTGFVDPTTPESVADVMMTEWINSPEHNKNLINPTIEEIGVDVRYDGEFFYATQNFF